MEHHSILGEVGNGGKATGHNATMGKHTNSLHGYHGPSLHPPLPTTQSIPPTCCACLHPGYIVQEYEASYALTMQQNYMVDIPNISKLACVGGHPCHGFGDVPNSQQCGHHAHVHATRSVASGIVCWLVRRPPHLSTLYSYFIQEDQYQYIIM